MGEHFIPGFRKASGQNLPAERELNGLMSSLSSCAGKRFEQIDGWGQESVWAAKKQRKKGNSEGFFNLVQESE